MSMSIARRVASTAAVFLAVLAFAGEDAAPAHAASSGQGIASWRFCTGCVDSGGDLARYGYVGMNAWAHDRIPALHAARAKALVYKDMSSTRSDSCGGLVAAGVDYCWASKHRPEWFTLDSSGRRIEWSGFGGVWQMDVGDEAYQEQWAANVIAELRANGWDGVVVDNANVDQSGYLGGRKMQEYPTQPTYQAATRSFLARVCPEVIRAGFLCLPNIQANPTIATARLWADWTQFTSGGTREYWTKWGTGSDGHFGDGGWADLMALFESVQAAGKIFVPVTYAPPGDVRSIRYARASFLLVWSGGPSAFVFAPTPEAQDPWSPEWTSALGSPLGPRYRAGSAWRRDFGGGTVIVNPSSSAAVVSVGAGYRTAEGAAVASIVLEPMSGIVLASEHAASASAPAASAQAATPLRASVSLKVGRMVRSRAQRTLQASSRAIRLRLRGRVVVGPAGANQLAQAARQGRRIVRLERWSGRRWRFLASVRTDRRGGFDAARMVAKRGQLVRVRAVVEGSGLTGRSRPVAVVLAR